MSTRKVIVIDKDIDMKLGAVCNAALKNEGLEVYEDVNTLIRSIEEEWMDDEACLFFEDED
jgi:hypothetical protein